LMTWYFITVNIKNVVMSKSFLVASNQIASNTVEHVSSYTSLHHAAVIKTFWGLINWNSVVSLAPRSIPKCDTLQAGTTERQWHIDTISS
jgi:hypothetical protein